MLTRPGTPPVDAPAIGISAPPADATQSEIAADPQADTTRGPATTAGVSLLTTPPAVDTAATAEAPPASLEEVVGRVLPAVASIAAGQARGTGFFVRYDQVLTNAHVIDGQTSVKLQVGEATYIARVVTVAQGSDLAHPSGLQPRSQTTDPPTRICVNRSCRTGSHRGWLSAWRALEHGDARHRQRHARRRHCSR